MKHSIALIAVALGAGLALPGVGGSEVAPRALIPATRRTIRSCRARSARSANAIGSQVANQIPALSTSAGYTYEWNPELEVLERSAKTFGPLFTERAVTLGRNKFNLNVSYTYIKFDEFNGKNLDKLDQPGREGLRPGDRHDAVLRPLPRVPGRQRSERHAPRRRPGDARSRSRGAALRFQLHLRRARQPRRQHRHPGAAHLRALGGPGDAARSALPRYRTRIATIALDTLGRRRQRVLRPARAVSRDSSLGIGDIHLRTKWAPITKPVPPGRPPRPGASDRRSRPTSRVPATPVSATVADRARKDLVLDLRAPHRRAASSSTATTSTAARRATPPASRRSSRASWR